MNHFKKMIYLKLQLDRSKMLSETKPRLDVFDFLSKIVLIATHQIYNRLESNLNIYVYI